MKLGICVPMYQVIPASFVINFIHRLTELYNNGRNYEVKIYFLMGTVIDRARNNLVKDALADGCDYIMFIDADMILPPNAVDNLIDMNVGIASGLYFTKGKPYLPVARIKKKKSEVDEWEQDSTHRHLEDFEFNKTMNVAAVGMGCCLIKAEVFKKTEFPWFKFEWKQHNGKHYQLAEDLYFCDNALKQGYKTFLNTGIICEHFGTEVGLSHFMMYKDQLKEDKENREDVISHLMKMDNISEDEVLRIFRDRANLRNNEWEETADKNSSKSIEDYYINNHYGIYDHFNWHLNARRGFDKKIVEAIKKNYPERSTEILDFGASGGQIAYMLAKEGYLVTTYEPNKRCNEFISARFKANKCKVKKLQYPLSKEIKNKYDVILCTDVLEHIPDEKFEETIDLIDSLKKPGGEIIATVSFGGQKRHPMHFDLTPEKETLLKKILKLDK